MRRELFCQRRGLLIGMIDRCVAIYLNGLHASSADFDEYALQMDGILARYASERLVIFTQADNLNDMSSEARGKLSRLRDRHREFFAKNSVGLVVVSNSALMRTLLRTAFMLRRYPMPTRVAATPGEGWRCVGALAPDLDVATAARVYEEWLRVPAAA
jgi:hypothetical protein